MKIKEEKRYLGGWWMWILGLIVVSLIVLGGLRAVGLIGQTAVERAVFTNSYQKSASDNAQVRMWHAQIAEIEARLTGMNADDPRREDLEAQLSGLRVQLRTVKGQ